MAEEYLQTPLWDSDLPLEERLDYLIEELTLEEKFSMLGTTCPAIERLGIGISHVGGEAAHGIQARHDQSFDRGTPEYTTSFSEPIGMASSWDKELMEEIGEAVSLEARGIFNRDKKGSLSFWAPTIDMGRDPRWGRNEECYGEDPHLAGTMSSAYIQGMKGKDDFYIRAACTLKHFYANNVEKNRTKITSSVGPKEMFEYYLEPFRLAVEGGAEAIMTSYNAVNGIPAMCNLQVQRIVKDEWGLKGHVVCDGGAMIQVVQDHRYFDNHAQTVAASLKAGVDCFTDDKDIVEKSVRMAYDQGLIDEEDMNRAIRHSFGTRIRLGFFDGKGKCPYHKIDSSRVGDESHQRLARQMAAESVVLLKNEKNILPLSIEKGQKVALVGPHANQWYMDWYGGIPPYRVTIYDALFKQAEEKGAGVLCHSGFDKVKLHIGNRYFMLDEQGYLKLTPESCGKEEAEKLAEIWEQEEWGQNKFTFRSLRTGKLLTMEEDGEKNGCIVCKKEQAFGWFVKEVFLIREQRGEAGCSHTRRFRTWNDGKFVIENDYIKAGNYEEKAEDLYVETKLVESGLVACEKLAKEADVVIVAAGCHPMINAKEEVDRTDLELPLWQKELARRISEKNRNMVLCLMTNYPYAMGEMAQYFSGIVTMATGNMEQGNGLMDVLTGRVSPAGRLPMTWYGDEVNLPDMEDYDIINSPRTYRYYREKVQYPFGYGLSYSTFSYEKLQVQEEDKGLNIHVSVKNTGGFAGDEVVQIYVARQNDGCGNCLEKKLVAYERVKNILPGETREVTLFVHKKELRCFDLVYGRMILQTGEYTIMAASHSGETRLSQNVYLRGNSFGLRQLNHSIFAAYCDVKKNAEIRFCGENIMSVRPWRRTLSGKNVESPNKEAVLCFGKFQEIHSLNGVAFKARGKEGAEIEFLIDGHKICEYSYNDSRWEFTEEQIRVSVEKTDNLEKLQVILLGEVELVWIKLLGE